MTTHAKEDHSGGARVGAVAVRRDRSRRPRNHSVQRDPTRHVTDAAAGRRDRVRHDPSAIARSRRARRSRAIVARAAVAVVAVSRAPQTTFVPAPAV